MRISKETIDRISNWIIIIVLIFNTAAVFLLNSRVSDLERIQYEQLVREVEMIKALRNYFGIHPPGKNNDNNRQHVQKARSL